MLSLNALDRCDRCIAQAYHVARKDGFADLLFCNHHFEEFEVSLYEQGFMVESDIMAVQRLSNRIDASANA